MVNDRNQFLHAARVTKVCVGRLTLEQEFLVVQEPSHKLQHYSTATPSFFAHIRFRIFVAAKLRKATFKCFK